MPFQSQVNQQPAPGIAGDFASANPRFSVDAGPGGLVAGAAGLICGRFAWVDQATFSIASNTGTGAPIGFVHREQLALITTYLAETSNIIQAGMPVTLMRSADMWVVNSGTGAAVPGMKAFANNATGLASFAATGTTPSGGSGSASSIAAGAGSVTGSIAIPVPTTGPGTVPGVLTVTAVGSGTLNPGGVISGTGVVSGTTIVAQLTGTTGGVGTYSVSIPQTVASTTITEAHGVLTVGGTVTGTFGVGQAVAGSGGGGVTAGTIITALGTGVGGAGTYIVNLTQTVTSSTITSASATETAWYCHSFGQPGDVVKINTVQNG